MGKKVKAMHFKSKAAYRRWLAYGHATGVFEKTPGDVKVYIRGKKHKVKHVRRRSSRRRRVRRR